jgi:hypothetical protein
VVVVVEVGVIVLLEMGGGGGGREDVREDFGRLLTIGVAELLRFDGVWIVS